jgi:hypothetical protein
MTSDVLITVLAALAALLSVLGLVSGVAPRLVTFSLVALVAVALAYGWSLDPSYEIDKPVAVLAAVVAVAGGGLVTTQVFSFVEDPERVRDAGAVLRGGAWIGALERLAVYVALVAGWAPGLAIVLAVKGLGRYPELRNQEDTGVAERFIIGTFTSVLWAVACAGVALLAS